MVKTEIKVAEGFEDIYDALIVKKEAIEEKYRKLAEIEAEKIDKVISEITEIVEVEVPDEEVIDENADETEEEFNN